jgi:hypothetical protein
MFAHKGTLPRCGLIIGHPGHELRVLGWLRAAKPLVAVLTDGRGHGGQPRLDLSRQVIESAGAEVSHLYGVTSDQELYRAILEQNAPFFRKLASQLTDLLVERGVECVAGDAIEGYNPAHDLCRLILDRAVDLAQRQAGRKIANYAFSLVGSPCPAAVSADQWRMTLNSLELNQKVAASRRYAQAAGQPLQSELEQMLKTFGESAFADEVLYPMETAAMLARFHEEAPFYEAHGARQVAAGHYTQIIRFREHIAPLADSLAAA